MKEPITKTQLAALLNISLSTLQRWLKKQGIKIPRGLISPAQQKAVIAAFGFETAIDPK